MAKKGNKGGTGDRAGESKGAPPRPSGQNSLNSDVPTTSGIESSATIGPDSIDHGVKNLSLANSSDSREAVDLTSEFPLRNGSAVPNRTVITNHFALQLDTKIPLFHYQIVGLPESMSKSTAKKLVEAMIAKLALRQKYHNQFVTDYERNLVSWVEIDKAECGPVDVQASQYKDLMPMSLSYAGPVNMKELQDYVDRRGVVPGTYINRRLEITKTIINMVITAAIDPNCILPKANKFFIDTEKNLNSGSLCAKSGFFFSVKAASKGVLLNVNSCTSAFYKPILVSEFLSDRDTFPDENDRLAALKGIQVTVIKGLVRRKVDENSKLKPHEGRVMKIIGYGAKVCNQTFNRVVNGSNVVTRVQKYFEDEYKALRIRNSDTPAINCGSFDHPAWFPAELLMIVPNQMYKKVVPSGLTERMLTEACKSPAQLLPLIQNHALQRLGVASTPGFQSLRNCPAILINPTLLNIPATKMNPVQPNYGSGPIPLNFIRKAGWNLKGVQFKRTSPKTFFNVHVITFSPEFPFQEHDISNFWKGLHEFAQVRYKIGTFKRVGVTKVDNAKDLETAMMRLKGTESNFVLLMLGEKSIPVYSQFKDIADRRLGKQSLCVRYRDDYDAPFWGNVSMKLNLKTAGGNHTVKSFQGLLHDTLVLGADVTHASPGSLLGTPSIAALVGSVNDDADLFLGSMRLQQRVTACEDIQELGSMVEERIKAWQEKNPGRVPKNILYYRDGVSESQYAQVQGNELRQIKDAYRRICKGEVKLTAVVVGKRHHTRLFPKDRADATGSKDNLGAGTLVDSDITSPYFSDFFLQSHDALQGTARPAHYFVLQNDMKLTGPDLQKFTHELCHTYVRASKSVSYAPPAYYADRLCERGRCYLRSFYANSKNSETGNNFDNQKLAYERAKSKTRQAKFGINTVKSEDEKRQIREDKEAIDKAMKKWTLDEAKVVFNQIYDEKPRGVVPYGMKQLPKLFDTMFWM